MKNFGEYWKFQLLKLHSAYLNIFKNEYGYWTIISHNKYEFVHSCRRVAYFPSATVGVTSHTFLLYRNWFTGYRCRKLNK